MLPTATIWLLCGRMLLCRGTPSSSRLLLPTSAIRSTPSTSSCSSATLILTKRTAISTSRGSISLHWLLPLHLLLHIGVPIRRTARSHGVHVIKSTIKSRWVGMIHHTIRHLCLLLLLSIVAIITVVIVRATVTSVAATMLPLCIPIWCMMFVVVHIWVVCCAIAHKGTGAIPVSTLRTIGGSCCHRMHVGRHRMAGVSVHAYTVGACGRCCEVGLLLLLLLIRGGRVDVIGAVRGRIVGCCR
mmetsp:Transcript_20386/g.26353  ORF Transcript_20386/g.26353 Transcript_20386/m.26353 type:complete len:243 (+) Transcript_20386:143-871(+)